MTAAWPPQEAVLLLAERLGWDPVGHDGIEPLAELAEALAGPAHLIAAHTLEAYADAVGSDRACNPQDEAAALRSLAAWQRQEAAA